MENQRKVKNKRQVYIWDENMQFFDTIKNKSRLINLLLQRYRMDEDIPRHFTQRMKSPDGEENNQ